MNPTERDRWRAWLAAVQAEGDGPGLSSRVRARQEELLQAKKTRGHWLPIDSEILGMMVARLDGHASTSLHLGIAQSTLRRWAERARIPAWAAARFRELILSGAPSRRRPNRAATRHRLRDEGDDT